jgi:hypothetical protein
MLTAALCFDGVEDDAIVAAAQAFLQCCARIESWCAYDDTAERTLEAALARHHGPPPPRPPHHPSLDAEQAGAIANHGVELLRRAGFTATPRTFAGRDAGHALATQSSPEIVLIIAAGHRPELGPKSVGHVARFMIDHARGPVLVLRLSIASS